MDVRIREGGRTMEYKVVNCLQVFAVLPTENFLLKQVAPAKTAPYLPTDIFENSPDNFIIPLDTGDAYQMQVVIVDPPGEVDLCGPLFYEMTHPSIPNFSSYIDWTDGIST